VLRLCWGQTVECSSLNIDLVDMKRKLQAAAQQQDAATQRFEMSLAAAVEEAAAGADDAAHHKVLLELENRALREQVRPTTTL
jgi:hypothetical protein